MTMTKMMKRQRTRVAVPVSLTLFLLISLPRASSAFTAVQQQQQSHTTTTTWNRHCHRRIPSESRTTSSSSRIYLAQNHRQDDSGDISGKGNGTATATTTSKNRSLQTADAAEQEETSSSSTSSSNSPPTENGGLPPLLSSISLSRVQQQVADINTSLDMEKKLEQIQNEIDSDYATVETWKRACTDFLSEPVVEVVDCALVLLSSLLVAVSTIPDLDPSYQAPIQAAENMIGSVFAAEFVARWFASNDVKRHFRQPMVLVDIVAVILPLLFALQPQSFWIGVSWVPNWLTSSSGLINLRLLRILRLQRVLQDMETFTKFEMALGISLNNVRMWQLQLARTVLSIFTLLSVSTGLIYTAEHGVNPNIPDYFTALYFGLTTLTTVGFGDIAPVSWQGRLVVSGSILAGVAVIPAQAAVLVEALLARQEERQLERDNALLLRQEERQLERDANVVASTSASATTTTSTDDPVREQKVEAVVEAKQQQTSLLVHNANKSTVSTASTSKTESQDLTEQPEPAGRMVLETEAACPSCGTSMHWSSAKFCWSCGEQL
jgi:voltage-gated potassium channel